MDVRYIVTFSKGMMQALSYVYLAEISQTNMRNVLMAAMCLSSDIGSMYLYLAGMEYAIIAAYIKVIFAVFGLIVMFFLPDSPYWLANEGRHHVAELSLAWFRRRSTPENAKSESKAIIRNAQNSPTSYKLFFKRSLYLPTLVVCSVFLANAFVRIFFETQHIHIVTMPHNPKYRNFFTLALCISSIISIAFVVLVTIIGKTILVLIYLFYGSMALLTASITGFLNGNDILSEDVYFWFLLFCLVVAHFSCIAGVVSVPLILNGELFPSKLRNLGAGFGSCFAFVVQVVSNNLFSIYFDFAAGALLALAIASFVGFTLLLWLFPRNDNKSLVEIEESSTDLLKNKWSMTKKNLIGGETN